MSAIRIKVHPAVPYRMIEPLSRGLATFLLVATIVIVLFAGTFPFDFAIPPGGISRAISRDFDDHWMQSDPGNIDRGENIVFFIPFGFALASVIGKKPKWAWQLGISIPAGAILSTTVELSQVLVSFRDPSLQDIWCNTLGSLVGAAIYVGIGDRLLRLAAHGLLKLTPLARPSVLGGALVIYAAAQFAAPLVIRRPGDLSVWDSTMPINIGNERTGDRPWEGTISNLILADRAATEAEALELSRGVDPKQLFSQSLIAQYRLLGKETSYSDQTDLLPPLNWADKPQDQPIPADQPVHVDPTHWLTTGSAIEKGISKIKQTSELTIAANVRAFHTDMTGPARIVTIANGTQGHDFTLGQDDVDLVIRLRTALRQSPDLHIHGVFADLRPHHVIVTHKQAQIVVYVDGYEAGRVEITPEAKVIWRIYPRNWFRIRIEKYGYRSYAAIYRLLVFIPFAALLGAMLATSFWSRRVKQIVAVAAIVGMSITLEIILGTQAASGFQPRNLIISLFVGFFAIGLMALSRLRRPAFR